MKKLMLIVFMLALSSIAFAAPDPEVTLHVEAFGEPYTKSFKIVVKFSEPVTGFGKGEIIGVNATIDSILGSKADYVVTVTPKRPGPMEFFIPAHAVRSLSTGSPNLASNKLKIMALNPVLNPSSNFDLTPWNLTLPIPLGGEGEAITIDNTTLVGKPLLNTGYTYPPYFHTNFATGSMDFFAPLNGASTPGGVNPRSELSEELHIRGMGPYWKLDTFESSTLSASLLVTQVTNPSKKIAIGKIQDKGTTDESGQIVAVKPLVKLYFDLNVFDPNGDICNGCVYARIRPIPAQDVYLKTVTLLNNTPLNKLFRYKITLLRDGTLSIRVNDQSTTYNLNTSTDNDVGWGTQELYFKAGVYLYDHGTSKSEGGAARFYSLDIKHKGCPYIP